MVLIWAVRSGARRCKTSWAARRCSSSSTSLCPASPQQCFGGQAVLKTKNIYWQSFAGSFDAGSLWLSIHFGAQMANPLGGCLSTSPQVARTSTGQSTVSNISTRALARKKGGLIIRVQDLRFPPHEESFEWYMADLKYRQASICVVVAKVQIHLVAAWAPVPRLRAFEQPNSRQFCWVVLQDSQCEFSQHTAD